MQIWTPRCRTAHPLTSHKRHDNSYYFYGSKLVNQHPPHPPLFNNYIQAITGKTGNPLILERSFFMAPSWPCVPLHSTLINTPTITTTTLVRLIMHCWSRIQHHPHFVFLAISIGITRGFRSIWQQEEHKREQHLRLEYLFILFFLDRSHLRQGVKTRRTLAPRGQNAISFFYKRRKRKLTQQRTRVAHSETTGDFCLLGAIGETPKRAASQISNRPKTAF